MAHTFEKIFFLKIGNLLFLIYILFVALQTGFLGRNFHRIDKSCCSPSSSYLSKSPVEVGSLLDETRLKLIKESRIG